MTNIDRDQAKAEGKIVERFLSVLSKKAQSLEGGSFQLEPVDKELLYSINNVGLWQGFLAGGVSLVLLRRARSNILKVIGVSRPGGPRMTTTPPPPQASPFAQPPLPNPPPPKLPQQSWFFYIFGWTMDSFIAFSVAAATSMYFTDVNAALDRFAQLPKTPGKSAVCDEFCPLMVREWKKLQESEEQSLHHPQSEPLQILVEFARNCEQRLAREHGLDEFYEQDDAFLDPSPWVTDQEDDSNDDP